MPKVAYKRRQERGERKPLRLVGFEEAQPFAERLARARGC